MKKLSKIRLTQLGKNELQTRQMNAIRGGASCYCACLYACGYMCGASVFTVSEQHAGANGLSYIDAESEHNGVAYGTCNDYY